MMTLSVRFSNANHGNRALWAAIALSVPLILPGCGIPPLRGPDPGAPVPQRFEDANSGSISTGCESSTDMDTNRPRLPHNLASSE